MPKEKDIVIDVKGLHKSYGDTKVLRGISFKVKRGTMLALLGPNGAGKTTIVRILSTLLKADKGSAHIEGHNIKTSADKIRKVIGLTGQSATIDELLTGRENLVMMGQLYRLTRKSAKERAQELLEDFDLVKSADKTTKTYSGGMRRRLDLAVSLIAVPPVIFLDEPTTGLDPRSRLAMWDIIRRLLDTGTTILLTTQYLEEADQLADQIVVIDNGKVIADGTAKELKSKLGKDRLELTFKDLATLHKAEEVLGKHFVSTNEKENSAQIIIRNTNKDVKDVLSALDQHDINVGSLAVHKPTLDDVFLSLTSKQAKKIKKMVKQ